MRIGQGYDIHRLVSGKKLVLGGVIIPSAKGEDGHSDGDVLIHAIIDAILGACALGDIGTHFPPSDPQYKDIKSTVLLERTLNLCSENRYRIVNIDATVILETPKLLSHIQNIRHSLSEICGIPLSSVSVKAKTKEKLDSTGAGDAVEALAAVLLAEKH